MTDEYTGTSPVADSAVQPPTPRTSSKGNLFFGPTGIRVGWRLLIFLVLDFAFVFGLTHIPGVRGLLQPPQIFTARGMLITEGLFNVLPLLLAAAVMTIIEKCSF